MISTPLPRERPHLTRFAGRWVCGMRYKSGLAYPVGEGATPLAAMAAWRFKAQYERAFPMPTLSAAFHALQTLRLPQNALLRDFLRDAILSRYPCLK